MFVLTDFRTGAGLAKRSRDSMWSLRMATCFTVMPLKTQIYIGQPVGPVQVSDECQIEFGDDLDGD
jgi:hypothetical protein